MSMTLSISARPSVWSDWSLGTGELGYTATGSGTPLCRGAGQPGRIGGALVVALTSARVMSQKAYALLVGTGGTAEYLIDQDLIDATTLESWGRLLAELGERSAVDRAEVLAGADLVAELKSTLGVNVTELATIARVSRQTIYDWIGEGQVSEANYERLFALRQVCLDWRARVKRPVGRLLHAKNADGCSLFDWLGQEPLDRTAIGLLLDALAVKAAEQAEQRRERNARLAPLSEQDQYENALTHAIPAADS